MFKSKDSAPKRRLNRKQKMIIAALIALIVIALLTVGVVFALNYRFFEEKTEPGTSGEIITESMQTPSEIKEKVVTFLVLGIADDPEERESTSLTDTIMVATVDVEKKSVSVLQIPRDTYVGNETSTGKINAIYKQSSSSWDYAGLRGLTQMIHEMFQLNIDHYVTVQMDGFKELVDLIGGVTMDVPVDMELNGTVVKAGTQTLNGEQAIAVVRTRNVYANADLGRMNTQKLFLQALIEKCLDLDLVTMTRMIPTVMANITTDLTAGDMLGYINVAKGMSTENIVFNTVPGYGDMVSGQSVYVVDAQETADLLNEQFRPYTEDVPASELQIKTGGGSSSGGSSGGSSSNRGSSGSGGQTSQSQTTSEPAVSQQPQESSQPAESQTQPPAETSSQPEESAPETSVPEVPAESGGDVSQSPIQEPGSPISVPESDTSTPAVPTAPDGGVPVVPSAA